jgi:hypothetical protein
MIESLFAVLGSGLKLWASKEAHKYIDKYIKLRKEYYAEVNKPFDQQDHAVIDNIRFELQLLSSAFSSSVGEPKSENMP